VQVHGTGSVVGMEQGLDVVAGVEVVEPWVGIVLVVEDVVEERKVSHWVCVVPFQPICLYPAISQFQRPLMTHDSYV
jgi:hypothetical protein